MSKLLSFIKLKRHLSFYLTKIKFRILVRPMMFMNFCALNAGQSYIGKTGSSLETRLSEHAITSTLTKLAQSHNTSLNCPDDLYLANLNTFPNLDCSEEFSDKLRCPTSLVYTNSKILYSCKYNNPNQLLILEALLIKRKLPE